MAGRMAEMAGSMADRVPGPAEGRPSGRNGA